MAKRYTKGCWTSLIIKETLLKSTIKISLHNHEHCYSQIKKKKQKIKSWCECGATGNCIHYWWEGKLPLRKIAWQFLKILNIDLPFNPAIPLLGMYRKGMKPEIQRSTSTLIVIATLFTIAKSRNKSSVHPCMKRIQKIVYWYNELLLTL